MFAIPSNILLKPSVLACSLVAGAVDTTSERVNAALWIFGIGLSVLAVHGGIFVYRSLRKKKRSGWVFGSVFGLSVVIIPVVLLLIAMSAGTSCGFGASNGPTFLLTFEIVGLVAQLVSWRVLDQRAPLPPLVPRD